MFISWTRGDKWQYGASINAQWASEEKHEIVLTVSFGPPTSGPDSGTIASKTLDLSIHRNGPENVVLQQGPVALDLNFTWENPEVGQNNPKINFNGNIIESAVANVGVDAYLNIIVEPATP